MEYIDYSKYFTTYTPFVEEKKDKTTVDFADIRSNLDWNTPAYNFQSPDIIYNHKAPVNFSDLFNGSTPSSTENPGTTSTKTSSVSGDLDAAISSHLGETYSQPRRKQSGYSDCSGFVCKVYKDLGIDLGFATSVTMYNQYTDHIDFDQVQKGDLVFLTPRKKYNGQNVGGMHRRSGVDPSHVGIVVEKKGTKIKVAENTHHKGKSQYNWYELGDVNKRESGVDNYSKGNGRTKSELLGFGRINLSKVQNRNKR